MIELNQQITVHPNSAYTFIQNGRIVTELKLDQYYPYCRLEMFKPLERTRTIEPDEFIITKIVTYTEYVMTKPIKLAAFGIPSGASTADEIYSTRMYIKSDINPDVELISCEYWRDPSSFEGHLTLEQIQRTLDGIFYIQRR